MRSRGSGLLPRVSSRSGSERRIRGGARAAGGAAGPAGEGRQGAGGGPAPFASSGGAGGGRGEREGGGGADEEAEAQEEEASGHPLEWMHFSLRFRAWRDGALVAEPAAALFLGPLYFEDGQRSAASIFRYPRCFLEAITPEGVLEFRHSVGVDGRASGPWGVALYHPRFVSAYLEASLEELRAQETTGGSSMWSSTGAFLSLVELSTGKGRRCGARTLVFPAPRRTPRPAC